MSLYLRISQMFCRKVCAQLHIVHAQLHSIKTDSSRKTSATLGDSYKSCMRHSVISSWLDYIMLTVYNGCSLNPVINF